MLSLPTLGTCWLQAWRLGAFGSGEKFQRSDCLSACGQGRPSQKEARLSC